MNTNNPNPNPNSTLPIELITEVLLRLPVKSLLCFKQVSKSWYSLISDPQFCNSHYDLAASPSHRLLLKLNDDFAQSIDTNSPFIQGRDEGCYSNHSKICDLRSMPWLLPSPRYNHPRFFDYQIWGSCRGLIILFYPESVEYIQWDLVLWNPSTGLYKQLPHFEHCYSTKEFLYGFGYDPSTRDYLIVIITFKSEIHIFSFKSNSWNKVDINVPYSYPGERMRAGLFLNGALHWLIFCQSRRVHVIVAFDLIQRSFSEIPVFDYSPKEKYHMSGLIVTRECLSMCCRVGPRVGSRGFRLIEQVVEIWVMKEYKVRSSWTKFIVIPDYRFAPICLTSDGGVFGSHGGSLDRRDHKGKSIGHVHYGEEEELYYCTNVHYAFYRESLLLPPGVIGIATEERLRKHVKMIHSNKNAKNRATKYARMQLP